MSIRYVTNDQSLTAAAFLELAQRVWPGDYDPECVREALGRTLNVTAYDGQRLIGCVRVLSDGYFFGTIPEILVAPGYRRKGVGLRLMALAWDSCPTSLFFGAQPGNEGFFEKAGFTKGIQSYSRRKPRRRTR